MEAHKSQVLTATHGDYDGAVTAMVAARNVTAKKKQAAGSASVSAGANKQAAAFAPAAPAPKTDQAATSEPTKPAAAGIISSAASYATPATNATNSSAAAAAATANAAPSGVPLSGVHKWLAGIVTPSATPGPKGARSDSTRRLLSWRSLLAADQPAAAAVVEDVPAVVETISTNPPAAAAAATPEAAAGSLASPLAAAPPSAAPSAAAVPAPVDDAVAAPPGEAETTQGDDAQFEDNQDATIMDVPIESEAGPVQALGEFAIVSDNPDEVRRKILASASNFGLAFYGLLHKFGITQRPSVFLDGTPILGPAAEALNPAAYNTAAAAAGLTGDGDDIQVGNTETQNTGMETVVLAHLVCEASIFMGYKVLIGGLDVTCVITVQRISLVDRHTPSRQSAPVAT